MDSLEQTSNSHDEAGGIESPAAVATEPVAAPEPEVAPDFVGLAEDGAVTFGDGFFHGAAEEAEEQPPVPYTPEDLKSVPLSQLDEARLPESVRPFFPLVREQFQRVAQKEQALAQREAILMHYAQQQRAQAPQAVQGLPKPPNPKELADQAMKLAAERLEIDLDDLDTYIPEHIAALSIATSEVTERARNEAQEAERSARQQQAEEARHRQGEHDFQGFASQLVSLPDFRGFDTWATRQLATRGMHPNQLAAYAQQTGDYAGVQRTITEMYQTWRQSAQQAAKPKAEPKVPRVEGAGGAAAVKKAVDLSQFAELGEDAQAKAIMDLGLV